MNKKFKLFDILSFIISFLIFISSCVTIKSSMPLWVKEFGTKTFSKDGIEGIGFASYEPRKRDSYKIARDNAYNDAIKNLALKLKTEVKGIVERQIKSQLDIVGKKHKEESQEILDSITQVMFDTVLGRKMFEEYQDEKTKRWWVFVWMNKEDVDKTIEEELKKQEIKNKNIMKACLELERSAKQYLFPSQGKPKVITAINIFENILSQLQQIKGFVIENGIDSISFKIEIENNIKMLLNSIFIQPLGETNFNVLINQPLDTFLTLKVNAKYQSRNLDVEMFPLKLSFIKGNGNIDLNVKTDENGIAKPKIYKLNNTDNEIEIVADIEELVKFSERFRSLENIRIRYYIFAKKIRELKKVYVEIKSSTENIDSRIVNTEIISILKKEGFNIVEEKDNAEYFLLGDFSIEYLGNKITLPDGKIMDFGEMHSGNINVELKDVKKNEVALSKNFVGIKGFGKTKIESQNNTIKKLGTSAADYIISTWQ